MLVVLKSAPGTLEGKRGVRLARDLAADLVFVQDAVFYAQRDRLEGFCGMAYVLDEDRRMRGLPEGELEKAVKTVSYEGLVKLMEAEENVIGIF
jgi:sulfur relay protein TusB/DsrH